MNYFSIFSQNSSNKSFLLLLRIITLLLLVIILMNGGTVIVSLAKIAYTAIESIFVSLLLSVVLAFILKPIVLFLENFNLSRSISISIVYLVIFLSLGSIFGPIIPSIEKEVYSLQNELPKYKEKIMTTIKTQETKLKSKYSMFENVNFSASISSYLKSEIMKMKKSDIFISSSKILGSLITLLVMVPFITFFLLKDGSAMKKSFISMIPNRYFEMSLNLVYEINRQLGGFIRARLLEALCVGLICFIGLTVLNVKYAAVLALFASITNLIPYVGPVIGAVPALFIAFVDTGNWIVLFWVLITFLLAQLFDIIIIIPAVFAKIVNMHPLSVVIAIIIGGQLGGIIGMILAVPLYSITKVTIREIYTGLTSLRT
jgi:putative permease